MKKNILIFAAATAVFALIFTASLFLSERKYEFPIDKNQLNILVMGDSIMENDLDGNNICMLLNNYIEADVINCAIGGSTAVSMNKDKELDYYQDKFNFYNIANVAVTGDLVTVFDNKYISENHVPDALTKVRYLAYTDLSKCDYLIIQYGMNDSTAGVKAASDDKYDLTTFGGVMRKGIEQIHKEYPDLAIIVNTVTYSHIEYEIGGKTIVSDTKENGILDAYNAELKSITDDYDNVYLFDVSTVLDINNNNYRDYLIDGIHLNAEAKKIFAENLAEYMRELEDEQYKER